MGEKLADPTTRAAVRSIGGSSQISHGMGQWAAVIKDE